MYKRIGLLRRFGLSFSNLVKNLIFNCGLTQYIKGFTDGIGIDKLGRSGTESGREAILAKYILGDGVLTANIGLNNEPIKYLDLDTMLEVDTTTDGSGLLTFPNGVKVARILIPSDGSIFYLEESLGDTIADSVNGRVVKLSIEPTFENVYTFESQADKVGYTKSNGVNYYWDESATDLIDNNVIIPNFNGMSVAYYSEAPPIDPRIQSAIDANATMLLMGDLATGTSGGVNAPITNPWVDVINSNNATLTNFAGTTSSGWDNVTVPSGTQPMLKADGVDDYGVIVNNTGLDPTGTEDFAICGVFKTDSSLLTSYLLAKNFENSTNMQYGILLFNTGAIRVILNGIGYNTPVSSITPNTIHALEVKRINGALKISIDNVEIYNQPNTDSLVSQPYFRLFARSDSIDGNTQSSFSNVFKGCLAFFYNGSTGLNETDVDNACALLRAPYF